MFRRVLTPCCVTQPQRSVDDVTEPQAHGPSAVPRGTTGRAGQAHALDAIPIHTPEMLYTGILAGARAGARLVGVWGWPAANDVVNLLAVLAADAAGRLSIFRTIVRAGAAFPSLTPEIPSAQAFEREIFESLGVRPDGHPWLKPLLRHADLEERGARADPHPFFRVEGVGVHEVAVGPVHAGIIEPGHFRFQCSGETVLHLEIQLGYQHRALQTLLVDASAARRLVLAESIAGDTVIGHATAYCQAMETLAGAQAPPRAQALRAIALELERVANHVGDLGALCGDVGYLPGAAYLGRLRGEFLNLLLAISGNRFGRGLVVPGGVRFDLDEPSRADVAERLARVQRDFEEVADLVFSVPSVQSRFERRRSALSGGGGAARTRRPSGARQRLHSRRARRSPVRLLPLRPHSCGSLRGWGRVRARDGPIRRGPPFANVRPGGARAAPEGSARRADRAAGGDDLGHRPRRGMARRDRTRRRDRRERRAKELSHRRSIAAQLARASDGHARAAGLRLPAL